MLAQCSATRSINIKYHNIGLIDAYSEKPLIAKRLIYCVGVVINLKHFLFIFPIVIIKENTMYLVVFVSNAASYNTKTISDYKSESRNNLLQKMINEITDKKIPIKYARNKELLKSFGGTMTIEEYRESLNIPSIDHSIDIPPVIPLMHVITNEIRDN